MRRRGVARRRLGAGLALLLVLAWTAPAPAAAAAYDPLLDLGWTWPQGTYGTWRFGSFPTTSWMRTAVTNALNTASHTAYANPDFEYTTGSSANVSVEYLDPGTNRCPGNPLYAYSWVGCAKTTTLYAPFTTWKVWLASNRCWANGAGGRTCGTDTGAFDLQTVTLNEMGHVNFLAHHVNPAYIDAVVQEQPTAYPDANAQMRAFRWADTGRLNLIYGKDCPVPPCPQGTGS